MTGLSGLGDLILTCSSPQSRNFSCGVALGKGEKPDSGKLAEGAFTAPVLLEMARAKNVDMPISAAVAAVLAGKLSVDEAIESLLTRPIKSEDAPIRKNKRPLSNNSTTPSHERNWKRGRRKTTPHPTNYFLPS